MTPLEGSGDSIAEMALKAPPRLVLGVAAGVATIFVARLLTFWGRKVRPWFRTPTAKLKALAPEIERLYAYETDKLERMQQTEDLALSRYLQDCNELGDKLRKISIPPPPRGGQHVWFYHWRNFLGIQYECAYGGDLKKARKEAKDLLEYLEKRGSP